MVFEEKGTFFFMLFVWVTALICGFTLGGV